MRQATATQRKNIADLATAIARLRKFVEINAEDKREEEEYKDYLKTLLLADEILPRQIKGEDL